METAQIEERAGALAEAGHALEVTDALSYEAAAELLLEVQAYRKRVADTFDPIISKAHGAHKEALAQKKKHEGPAITAATTIKGRMLTWQRAEQKRADEEARAAEAEAQRQAEEEQLAAAAAAEEAGDAETAEAIISEPPVVAPVMARSAAPKVAGITVRKQWDFVIDNAAALPREYLMPDVPKIRGVVRAMKGGTKIAGVRVFEKDVMGAGSR